MTSQHAGDVCGEKVILTTELRDLHSRLVSLSNDRDKSLADLDEVSFDASSIHFLYKYQCLFLMK